MVEHDFNPITQEAEPGKSLYHQTREFQDGYIVRPCLQKGEQGGERKEKSHTTVVKGISFYLPLQSVAS